ncbi:uncharacterized protein LTR77_003760 [Saxophila tyrrhenica]|uniref:Cytochrome b561 domain-containing protein n=1 Tax=Saxophila tyrrhenica TaxID=1690608 RepID=A0AAV9PIJ3_9PEZI|nr:hypothetical protein LTR77_003760 [Saxophila tyrrhenica]
MRASYVAATAGAAFASIAVAWRPTTDADNDKVTVSKACPFEGLCYELNIPNITATTGRGDIFFQVRAKSDYQWVGLGQGSGMTNANIFVFYQAQNGKDVTVSPRIGVGHEEPLWDSRADIELLDGSGIKDGWMTANVRCGDCDSWASGTMDFTKDRADWIYAVKKGEPLNSNDVEVTISKHDRATPFTWPLKRAKGGDSSNPFLDADSNVSDDSSSGAESISTESSAQVSEQLVNIHGGLATLSFVILFPIGGILIRLANFRGGLWIHVGLQIVAWIAAIGAIATGARIANAMDLFMHAHPIIGAVLALLLIGQPVYGWIHHKKFKQIGQRTKWSYAHLTIGRVAVFGGMINGGLGIMLAGDTEQTKKIAYAVIASVLAVLYIAAIVWGERRRKRTKMTPTGFRTDSNGNSTTLFNNEQGDPHGGHEMRRLWLSDKRRGHQRSSTEYAPLAAGEGYGEESHSRSHSRAPSVSPSGRYSDGGQGYMDAQARASMT